MLRMRFYQDLPKYFVDRFVLIIVPVSKSIPIDCAWLVLSFERLFVTGSFGICLVESLEDVSAGSPEAFRCHVRSGKRAIYDNDANR